MRFLSRLSHLAVLLCCSPIAYSATIAGTVRGPEGAAFRGAFVAAQNAKTRIAVYVLSDPQGHYRIPNLPAGQYTLFVRSIGHEAQPQAATIAAASQNLSFDFAIQKSAVRWSDLSGYQGKQLLPPGKQRNVLVTRCSTCHFFQNRWVPLSLDVDGWKNGIEYMKALTVAGSIDQKTETDLATYLASAFGPDSVLPKSPEQAPGYGKAPPQPVTDDALNIVYVEYEMPQPHYFPFSAAPDNTGHVWIPNHGATNKITRLDPETGAMQDFQVPYTGPALIHSAVPAPDGTVWLAESGRSHVLGKWDPATQKITEYVDNIAPPGQTGSDDQASHGELAGAGPGQKHTVRIDKDLNVWSSGIPLTEFDRKTGKFTHFNDAAVAYDVKPAPNGDVWFTFPSANRIGKVDAKTRKVSMWEMPTPNIYPRRMEIGPDGMIWVGEAGFPFSVGKMARFDPRTQTFKEYVLPGPDPSPYALGFDADGYLWYDSHYQDTVNRFDTRTGKIIEYPFPHAEISHREFFRDRQGRMWYGSNPNNKVGYFYLTGKK